jgi:glycerol-3-phosphate O-acyltransferase
MEEVAMGSGAAEVTLGPLTRFGLLPRLLCRLLFSRVRIDPGVVEHIQNLSRQGAIIYVMRYRSLVDTLLVLNVLLREGLPIPELIADLPTLWLRPWREILPLLWSRGFKWRSRKDPHEEFEKWERCRRLVADGRAVLIFMRDRAPGVGLYTGRPEALEKARLGTNYLREIVIAQWSRSNEAFVVPLAILRGRGYRRRESRLATLIYTVQEAPGEMKRLLSLAWNRRDVAITVGKHVDLRELVARYREEGAERIVKRLARALQIFLHREERLVQGPTLLPKRVVREIVLQEEDVRHAIREAAKASGKDEAALRRTAEKCFDEMAANFHGSYFALIEFIFRRIWTRMFQGLEPRGLEKVIECAKVHPVVLVPCHRSHFDYLVLSYLFHINYLSPPHIAAGVNLSFWPLGPLFRGAGAYFIRRSFGDDEVYKAVFRSYLKFLVREGYTQEFFIEGGRSRTGKILTPKLGMLTAIVEAFLAGARRDLYLVPVSIHYGRVVEEQAYSRELSGAEKEKESLWALLRARALLRQKYGTVSVSFGDPISLNDALGDRKERLRARANAEDAPVEEEKRRFIRKLGFRILREVNRAAVAGSTSVSATVLLSSPNAAWRYDDFLPAAQQLVQLLRHQGVEFTAALRRNEPNFLESLAFLEYSGLARRLDGGRVIHVPSERRVNLDFYKNNTIHFFVLPALLLEALNAGVRPASLGEEIQWWLDLYRWEFPLPEREGLAEEIEALQQFLRAQGVVAADGRIDEDHPLAKVLLRTLEHFHGAYWLTARTAARVATNPMPEKAFRNAVRKGYETALLLGELTKPEGNSTVTVDNAINRYAEMQLIQLNPGREGSKERRALAGERYDDLGALVQRLRRTLDASAIHR